MILGVGTDLCAIDRIGRAIENPRFLARVYTPAEQARLENLCDSRRAERAAGMFAAKEAVAKAKGTGFTGFGFSDIEIMTNEQGQPHAILRGGAALPEGCKIHISISHDGGMALAFAVISKEETP